MVLFHYEDEHLLLGHILDSDTENLEFPIHFHDNYELYCFVSGDAHYMVEGRIWQLSYGSVLLMRPGESHRLILDSAASYERYILNFSAEALPEEFRPLLGFLENGFPEEKTFFKLSDFSGISPIDLFESACSGEYDKSDLHIKALLPALLSVLYTGLKKEKVKIDTRSDGAKMVDWLNRHLLEPITLGDLAAKYNRSVSQTQRIFFEATGTTVGKYCKTKRLLKARQMIMEGKSAENACFNSGFSDYSAFFRLYKKQFGCAPSNTAAALNTDTQKLNS